MALLLCSSQQRPVRGNVSSHLTDIFELSELFLFFFSLSLSLSLSFCLSLSLPDARWKKLRGRNLGPQKHAVTAARDLTMEDNYGNFDRNTATLSALTFPHNRTEGYKTIWVSRQTCLVL